ncbi:DUF3291 domain-containing protein [Streptomyces sp. NPDC047130]|uniref:DUF3291 domain-containing protein n=1 Tax=Streptomyces sp. NPDC047130 TaxID=3155261 RepID=UPI0033C72327
MPTLPWTVSTPPPEGADVHVFASRFETRTRWGALRFFLGTPAVRRQVATAPGAYGASLRAAPLRRTFWTVSAWESPEALRAFARSGPHGPAARRLAATMKDKRYASWRAPADGLPVAWDEVLRRLG